MTVARAVLDANVFVRSAVQRSTSAREWLEGVEEDEVDGHVPELVYAEVASSYLQYVRLGAMRADEAQLALETVVALPLRAHRLRELSAAALAVAAATDLSAYDACYAVLADSLDAVLVTADRRLARSVARAELVA